MVQSLSPEETSKWCDSLAPCGLRGETLAAVKSAIRQQGIDGKRFDGMLRANALQELGIQGLNPRLSVAIRRAWNTDFANVEFIPHHMSQNAALTSRSNPTPNAHGLNSSREPPSYEQRTRSAEARANAERRQEPQHAENHRLARELQALQARRNGGEQQYFKDQQGTRLDETLAPKAPAANSYAAPQPYHKGGRHDSEHRHANDRQDTSLGELLAPKAPAPHSFAAPQPHFKVPPHFLQDADQAQSLGDCLPAKGQAPTSFSPPQNYGRGAHHARQDDPMDAPSLGALLPPQGPAQTSFAPPVAHQRRPQSGRHVDQQEGGLADIFAPRPKAATSFAAPSHAEAQDTSERQLRLHRHAGSNPDGSVDMHSGRSGNEPQMNSRAPAADVWGGISLGDALGPTPKARNRYGAPEDTPSRIDDPVSRSTVQTPTRRADAWQGASLGDVMAPRGALPTRGDAETAPRNHVQEDSCLQPRVREVDDPWAGIALGDAPAAKPGAAPAASTPRVEQVKAGGRRNSGRQEADPWAGVSLGDALGPKPAAPPPPAPEPRRGGAGRKQAAAAGGACDKSSTEIIKWLRDLPVTHVPEKTREDIVAVVEEQAHNGNTFTEYVQTIPAELCAPKHAMKLKAAWKNVLAESEARAICRNNLDHAANAPKAVAITC